MNKNMGKSLYALVILVSILLSDWVASASHFRYGTLNWLATGEGRTVTFTIDHAWRRSYFNDPNVGDPADTSTLFSPIVGGDRSFNIVLILTVVNTASDWFLGTATISYEYDIDGMYIAHFQSCCRIESLINNADGDFRVTSQVIVQNNVAKQGIVTTIPPIVTVTFNYLNMFMLPTLSPDDPFIRFYIATSDQAAGVGKSWEPIDGLTIDPVTGVVSWFADAVGLHTMHFIVEGFNTEADANARVNSIGSTSVDFLIDSVEPVGIAPEFSQITQNGMDVTFDTMLNDTVVIEILEGETLDLTVFATDPNMGDTVTVTPTSLPSGANQMSNPGNPGSFNIEWTPPTGSMGAIICYTASDNDGNTTPGQLCIQIQISSVPVFTRITQAGVDVVSGPVLNDTVVIVLQDEECLNLTVYATDADVEDIVTINLVSHPDKVVLDSNPGNPGMLNVYWVPPSNLNVTFCFTASDDKGNTTPDQLCVKVVVNLVEGVACGDPHITSFWGCHIDAPKSEERALLMACENGDYLSVSYYAEFDYRIRTVWTVRNGKKESYKWKRLKHKITRTICGNVIEFHRYHAGINLIVKEINNRNIGGMFNDSSCFADNSKLRYSKESISAN